MLCFVVVMQSSIMNSHEVFIHIHQGCFAGTGAIVRLPQCQRSKPDGYGKISQCLTTTKHSKAKTVCIFLGIYCNISVVFPFICQWHYAVCSIWLDGHRSSNFMDDTSSNIYSAISTADFSKILIGFLLDFTFYTIWGELLDITDADRLIL